MSKEDIQTKVKEFILHEFLPGEDPSNLTETTELITGGILDSLATLKLVAFLEENYGVNIAPHELVPENLNTVSDISDFVQTKGG